MTLAHLLVQKWRSARPTADPKAWEAGRLHALDAMGVGLAASTLDQGEPYRRFAAN